MPLSPPPSPPPSPLMTSADGAIIATTIVTTVAPSITTYRRHKSGNHRHHFTSGATSTSGTIATRGATVTSRLDYLQTKGTERPTHPRANQRIPDADGISSDYRASSRRPFVGSRTWTQSSRTTAAAAAGSVASGRSHPDPRKLCLRLRG